MTSALALLLFAYTGLGDGIYSPGDASWTADHALEGRLDVDVEVGLSLNLLQVGLSVQHGGSSPDTALTDAASLDSKGYSESDDVLRLLSDDRRQLTDLLQGAEPTVQAEATPKIQPPSLTNAALLVRERHIALATWSPLGVTGAVIGGMLLLLCILVFMHGVPYFSDEEKGSRLSTNLNVGWQTAISMRGGRSTLKNWWMQRDRFAEKSAVAGVVDLWKHHEKRMHDAELWKQIEEIFNLELALAEIDEAQRVYVLDLIRIIVDEVEVALGPVPDEETLTDFSKNLVQLQKNTYGTEKSLQQWAQEKRFDSTKIPPADLLKQVQKSCIAMRQEYQSYPILHWFIGGLLLQLSRGKYAQFEDPAFGLLETMIIEKNLMKWSTIGWIAAALVRTGVVDSNDFSLSTVKQHKFMKLQVSVLPRGSFALTQLHGVLEGQEQMVSGAKANMLAFVSCVAIIAAQVLAPMLLGTTVSLP